MSLSDATPVNDNEMPTPTGEPEQPTSHEQPALPVEEQKPATSEEPEKPGIPEPAEDKPEGDKGEEEPTEKETDLPFEETGNEVIDQSFAALHDAGVDFNKAFEKFSQTGQESDIDFDYIESVVGKNTMDIIMNSIRNENARIEAEDAKSVAAIKEAAGGDEMWEGVKEWIASGESGLTKEGWQAYNDMLGAGGVQAELAARELSRMYQNSPGFQKPADLVEGDATSTKTPFEPIGRVEYAEQMRTAVRKHGENSPEVQALNQRRLKTMQQG